MATSRRRFLITGGLAAGALLATGGVTASATPRRLTRADVVADLRKAADYWIAQPPPYGNNADWVNATFHSGNMALWRLVRDRQYRDYTLNWARANDFALIASNPYDADHECAGQVYLDLYADDPDPAYLASTRDRLAAQFATGRVDYWTWVDALHMGMPTFVRLGVQDGKESYVDYAHAMYTYTKSQDAGGFYDPGKDLWWRDATFVGTDTYWSRGNGWAIAALVKVLAAQPSSQYRAEYVTVVRQLAAALRAVQRPDGFWNASLTQPTVDAGPETSGTAFHTYGIAWGINNGILDPRTYLPVVHRAWQALTTVALHPDGLLGYVQGTGSKPSDHYPWSATDTGAYAVGGFLLAGTEVAKLVS